MNALAVSDWVILCGCISAWNDCFRRWVIRKEQISTGIRRSNNRLIVDC